MSAAEIAATVGMQTSALCARTEVWTVINFTDEAREMIIESLLSLIPSLSDEALWHISVVLIDEERIKNQGGVDSE